MASTDIVSNVDTTGIAPGPHAKLEGVTPVFDLEREQQEYDEPRDISDEERWAEKAVASGGPEEEDEDGPDPDEDDERTESEQEAEAKGEMTDQVDTSGTDEIPASGVGHEEIKGNITDTVDTSGTGGEPSDGPEGNVEAASDLTGPESATAVASDPKSDAETPNQVEGDPVTPERNAWDGLKVTELNKIAKDKGVEVPGGSTKAEIIEILMKAGVKPPAASDAQSAPSA